MADIRPIQPLLYNPAIAGDISSVLTPPYDVIGPAEQEMYRARSPYSAIHVELPVSADGLNAYNRAQTLLQEWKEAGALRETASPALFLHRQGFEVDGRAHSRTALLAGVRLEPWEAGVVLPHERTFRGPKQDRLQLLRATAVAPSSIFGLYEQPSAVRDVVEEVTRSEPLITAEEVGVTHRLWPVDAGAHVQAVVDAMRDRQLYIADGHHRYETALAYRDERRSQDGNDQDAAYNFVAMSLVAFDDPGLVVLPTHRLVSGLPSGALDNLRGNLSALFTIEPAGPYEASEQDVGRLLAGGEPYAFVLYDGRNVWRVTGGGRIEAELPRDRSAAWRQLDLAALHELVLGRALGIPTDRTEEYVSYTRDVPGAFDEVTRGDAQLACFVRPTEVRQLRAVADASDKMPQKSTYFYPKFPAGLVINQLDVVLPEVAGVA